LYKPYKTSFYEETNNSNNQKKYDEIIEIKFFECKGDDNKFLAWGWYGISQFVKQIPKRPNYFRGIRLRKGNIEIGDEQTLVKTGKVAREDRANCYFIGEIYCTHPNLIPNSRRDYFNENEELKLLERKLQDLFHNTLHNFYYTASNYRGAAKTVHKFSEIIEEIKEKETTGYTSAEEKQEYFIKLDAAKRQAADAERKIQKIENAAQATDDPAIGKIISYIKTSYQTGTSPSVDVPEPPIGKASIKNRSNFNKNENKLINRIEEVIKKNLTPDISKPLIQKIEEELAK
jgi:molecular chaperone HtpG